MTLRQRQPRVRDRNHMDYIRKLPCLICGACNSTEAAHIRYPDSDIGKRPTGMGERPDDKWTTPLCGHCHRIGPNAQHSASERLWWESKGLDPLEVAKALYEASGDVERGIEIIFNAKRKQTNVEGT